MSFVSNLSILYDVDIINDSYILLSNDKIETYNHIPKELNDLYGDSISNKERKYYNDQVKRLYTKIGNEILKNFKIYQFKEETKKI